MGKNIKFRNKFLITICIVPLLLFLSCTQPGSQVTSSNQTGNVTFLPPTVLTPPPLPPPGNPKLDGALNALVEAQKIGGAEALARQGNIDMVDGKVRVHIDTMPGNFEAAIQAVKTVGVVEITIPGDNEIQALLPITSLDTLAGEKSIRFIKIPIKPTFGYADPTVANWMTNLLEGHYVKN